MKRRSIIENLLKVRHKDELLYSNNERALLISSTAYGIFQRDLIANIGLHRMKNFFYRYGFQLGKVDAELVLKMDSLSLMEKIEYGPLIHRFKGFEDAEITYKNLVIESEQIKNFHYKGKWIRSFEAEQYIANFGKSDAPVCYTLIGLVTGYVSTILRKEVYFKEIQCEAEGAPYCSWEGRLLSDWEENEKESFIYHNELPLIKELEEVNEKLKIEKRNLEFVSNVSQELTNELIRRNDVKSILNLLYRKAKLPIVMTDTRHNVIAHKGITLEEASTIANYSDEDQITRTKLLSCEKGKKLATPIYLLGKVVGYCFFLYEDKKTPNKYIDSMIIEQLAQVASLIFLIEKTEFEAMERVKGYFLEDIVAGRYTKQEIMRKADYIRLDLADRYFVSLINYHFPENCEEKQFRILKRIYEAIADFFNRHNMNVLHGNNNDSILLLITEKQLGNKYIKDIMDELITHLKKVSNRTNFLVGVSSKYNNIMDIQYAINEARSAGRLSLKEKPIMTFDELGIIGVLISEQDERTLRKVVRDTLGELYEDLDLDKLELLETLDYFFMNGGNLEQTATQLALSISGLRYRINKITKILRRDIRDPQVQYQLQTALSVFKIIDFKKIKSLRN